MKFGGLERILRKSAMFLVGGALAFNLINCGGKEEGPTAPVNQAPETYIEEGPVGEIDYNNVVFEWFGEDPNGSVNLYKYKLDPLMDDYEFTNNTSKTFNDLGNDNYSFYVAARDNSEEWDPTPAERSFIVSKEYTIILQPGQEGIDAYVYGKFENGESTEWCNENFDNNELWVGYELTYIGPSFDEIEEEWISYIKFDEEILSVIPSNATITNATLSLFQPSYSTPTWGTEVQVSGVDSSWTESGITFNNKPAYSGVEDIEYIDSEGEKLYNWNIPNVVQGWINGDYDNNGLVLKLSPGNIGWTCSFYSSDYNDSSKRPKLEIKYK